MPPASDAFPKVEVASALTAAKATTMTRSPTTTMPSDISLMGPAAPVSLMIASVTVGDSAEKTTPMVSATTARCAQDISPMNPRRGLAASTPIEMTRTAARSAPRARGEDRDEASADPAEAQLAARRQGDETDGDAVDELQIAEHPLGDEVGDARPREEAAHEVARSAAACAGHRRACRSGGPRGGRSRTRAPRRSRRATSPAGGMTAPPRRA